MESMDYHLDHYCEFLNNERDSQQHDSPLDQLEEAYKLFPKDKYILLIETFKFIIDNLDYTDVLVFYNILNSLNIKHKQNIFDINTMFNCINTNFFAIIAKNGEYTTLINIYTYTNLNYSGSFQKLNEPGSLDDSDSYMIALQHNNHDYSKILLNMTTHQNDLPFKLPSTTWNNSLIKMYNLIIFHGDYLQIILISKLFKVYSHTKQLPIEQSYELNYRIFKHVTDIKCINAIYAKNSKLISKLMLPGVYGPIISDINIHNSEILNWIISTLIRNKFPKYHYSGLYPAIFNATYNTIYHKIRNKPMQDKLLTMTQEEINQNPAILDCFKISI